MHVANGALVDGIDLSAFSDSQPVAALQAKRCRNVSREQGVYLILRTSSAPPVFVEPSPAGSFKGIDPSVTLAVLRANWVGDATILYIGKAGGKKGLYQRLRQYMDHGLGKPVGHRGGRYIWQLADRDELLVCWQATIGRDPRDVERDLIARFVAVHGRRPFANLAN